ncbi:MAG: hydroxymethylbilane synthase, partial [Planctomycetia bacterium]
AIRGDVVIRPVRGNVDTRLRRLDSGDFDALVLAGAGLERLGLAGRITEVLRPDAFWPAVSQGALGIQVRTGDDRMLEALRPLDHADTHAAVRAERSFLAALAGGCLAPVGGYAARSADGRLEIGGCVLEDLGDRVERVVESVVAGVGEGPPAAGRATLESPESLGRRLAAGLQGRGADEMLARMRERAPQG